MLDVLDVKRDKLERVDKVDDRGRGHATVEGDIRGDSEKYFDVPLESEEMESGER